MTSFMCPVSVCAQEVLTQASDTLTAGPYTHSPSHTSHIDNSDTFTVTATPLNVLRPIALNQMPVRAAHNQQQQQQQEQGGPTQPAAPGKKQQVAAQAAVALHTRPEWQARVVRSGGGGMAGVGHTATTPVWPPPPQQHTRVSHTQNQKTRVLLPPPLLSQCDPHESCSRAQWCLSLRQGQCSPAHRCLC